MGMSYRRASGETDENMKMITVIERNLEKGFFPALTIDASTHDYATVAAVGEVPLDVLTADARTALGETHPEELRRTGAVMLYALGYEVSVPRRVAECLALYDPSDRRVGDLVGLVHLTSSSNFRQARLVICRKVSFGAYEQVPPQDMPMPVVPPSDFARACSVAIDEGRVSMASTAPKDGKATERGGTSQRSRLCDYRLDVSVSGVRKSIRLDIAMALVKRADRLPEDAYGDAIVGATYPMVGKPTRKWVITYVTPHGHGVKLPDTANIDHVIPQSLGGRTRLCNLQVMRAAANARKSSEIFVDVTGEPGRSAKVVLSLVRGLSVARQRGDVPEGVIRSLTSICHRELSACAEFVMGGNRPRPKSGEGSRGLAVAARSAISSSFGTVSMLGARIRLPRRSR